MCWPCKLYEEQQLAAGVPQSEVRPARWQLEARGMTIADLPGGSRSTVCGLCPVRQGAFKRTTDARMWCHVVGGKAAKHPCPLLLLGVYRYCLCSATASKLIAPCICQNRTWHALCRCAGCGTWAPRCCTAN